MESQIKISKGQIQDFISDSVQSALNNLNTSKADLSSVVLKNGNTDGTVLNIGTNDDFNVRFERNNIRKAQLTAATLGLVEGVSLANDANGNKFQLGVGTDTSAPAWSRNTADAISTAIFWNINNSNTGYIIEGRSGSASGGTLNFYVDKTGKTKVATPTLGEHATNKDYVDTALALKANLASPTFTGTPLAPTAAPGTNTTQVATTAFVQSLGTGYLRLVGQSSQNVQGTIRLVNTSDATIEGNINAIGFSIANTNNSALLSPSSLSFNDRTTANNISITKPTNIVGTNKSQLLQDKSGTIALLSDITDSIVQTITNGVTTSAPSQDAVFDALALKQATLVSGTNIKTVGGQDITGSGNVNTLALFNGTLATTAPAGDNSSTIANTGFVQQELAALALKTKTGTNTQSGNGTTTTFLIPHGLGAVPTYFNAIPTSAGAGNISYYGRDATNIIINYSVAPPVGSGNLSWTWIAR